MVPLRSQAALRALQRGEDGRPGRELPVVRGRAGGGHDHTHILDAQGVLQRLRGGAERRAGLGGDGLGVLPLLPGVESQHGLAAGVGQRPASEAGVTGRAPCAARMVRCSVTRRAGRRQRAPRTCPHTVAMAARYPAMAEETAHDAAQTVDTPHTTRSRRPPGPATASMERAVAAGAPGAPGGRVAGGGATAAPLGHGLATLGPELSPKWLELLKE